MLKKKKTLIASIIAIAVIAYLSTTAFAAIRYSILVNGSLIKGEAKVIDGVTYVPMRTVVEKLGGTYHVMTDQNKISIQGQDRSMFGGYTKSNPLYSGSVAYVAINKGSQKFIASVSSDGMSTGTEAWKNFKPIKEPAPKGYSFLFVKMNFKLLSTEDPGSSVRLHFYNFNFLDSKTGELIPSIPLLLDEVTLRQGESYEDWIGFLIREDEKNYTISYSFSSDSKDALWMKV
ncbi:hypothetical protein ACFSR7_26885 [Cohnella sp. GCM10020058]|uniref:hypothetical protein n=1 Tax=Cohnella sp. GCM10020058 TaxID=3317330 RepID=UPI00363D88A4